VPPVCVTDRVDIVVVDVIALSTTVVLVTFVWIVDEAVIVDRVDVVLVKATTKVTGKLGIANLQIYPD
jgi:hypothetical protein